MFSCMQPHWLLSDETVSGTDRFVKRASTIRQRTAGRNSGERRILYSSVSKTKNGTKFQHF
jgi:hypothetical protein